ncbi:MAG TPA: M14 family metallopeptidase [Vicinamibacterales bacterium]|nr:M14 family metallopeptidase [Vicinamibacterales bacterium]
MARQTRILLIALLAAAVLPSPAAQTRITTPKEHLGFNFGDDYQLANYAQISAYWHKLDAESDRLVVREIGRTAEGRPHLMVVVTSPENHRNLEKYRNISRRLAFAEGVSEEEARALARTGRAVVWIDGGLHATETLGAQQLAEMVYQMASRSDEETMRFLDECIILFVHANPDGNDLVADWYMRNPDPLKRSTGGLPRLYQKYIGHDNNRDFFASTQAETENINRALYHDWMPQILYNHHQSGPAGTVVWSSPQRDPYNYNLDPLLILGLQALGTHMHQRLAAEGKPGATMAAGGPYDGWWNGGIRNTGNFHNIIAILTETIGNPTPMRIPLVLSRQLPSRDLAYPIAPQEWRFRQSIDYSISFNRAVIDYAARNREHLLYNIYRMGRRAIERGSQDTWTPAPARYAAVEEKMGGGRGGRGGGSAERDAQIWAALHRPEHRDPRGYIIPSDQPDFLTATKFINALREVNVTVHRATAGFDAAGKRYPAGSYVVLTAQAFRPHVIDMFEPQDHPNVFPYSGAPPTPPYDNAGWTLAFQMGVQFDRILEPFSGPFEKITDWNAKPPPGRVTTAQGTSGYTFARAPNDSVTAVNRLLAAGENVSAIDAADGSQFFVAARQATLPKLQEIATQIGVSFTAVTAPVPPGAVRFRPARTGLWDRYGGSMESGWTRWILEQFEFPFSRVFAQELDGGGLEAKYDVLVFPDGAFPSGEAGGRGGRGGGAPPPDDVPAEYRSHLGQVTAEGTIPRLREFVENGGTIVAIGSSAAGLSRALALPIENHLVENGDSLPRTKYFVPGSVVAARVDASHPAAAGMPERADFFFDNSPVFRLKPGAQGVHALAWFDGPAPLRSGWAWGQHYLDGGVIAVEARVGKGRLLLYGPEILQRAQPHGTFKLLFNALLVRQ